MWAEVAVSHGFQFNDVLYRLQIFEGENRVDVQSANWAPIAR